MRISLWAALATAAFGLSACGDGPLQQGIFGATAGTGAAVVTGGDPVTGAALGAAANLVYCRVYGGNCK